jgi:hypothetical protein
MLKAYSCAPQGGGPGLAWPIRCSKPLRRLGFREAGLQGDQVSVCPWTLFGLRLLLASSFFADFLADFDAGHKCANGYDGGGSNLEGGVCNLRCVTDYVPHESILPNAVSKFCTLSIFSFPSLSKFDLRKCNVESG